MKDSEIKIPSGNVTFLFTDIEGSTKLSQDFPDLLPQALDRHNEILRNAVESNSGFVFKIIGDAYCCAFENPKDAVKAAVEAQTDLTNEKWDEAVVKVRMGIHSGNAEWKGNDYMGYITLARVARVMSAAYGEQILISGHTQSLCLEDSKTLSENKPSENKPSENKISENKISEKKGSEEKINKEKNDMNSLSLRDLEAKEISFRDLGERRLKDVIQPIRLYQIVSKGLREDFPPLKTLDARPNNLPVQLTSFIGREKEIKDVKKLIRKNHLLSIIGPGGSGKTRLAAQAAAEIIDDFPNGVFIIELAQVTDPGLIIQFVMKSIGIKEESRTSPIDTLISYLNNKELLLIIDNCEHLINECADLTEKLLVSSSKLKIISTSREVLNCSGEQSYKIPMLSVPDNLNNHSIEDLYKFEASQLFIERAYSVNSDFKLNESNFKALAEICRHLDGIPLALELAAASTKFLSIENIKERLDDCFSLLTGGRRTALPKHQTLKALIDWSYELLSNKERLLWRRLSVFKGGWDLNSAEEICSDEELKRSEIMELHRQLTEKSIINFNEKNERYTILEIIKKYGEEKFTEEDESDIFFNRHSNHFLKYSENSEDNLYGSEILFWLDKFEANHLNFQSAIESFVANNETEKGARLAVSLRRFWDIRGYYSVGIKFLFNILQNRKNISKPVLGKTLIYAAQLYRFQGEFESSRKYYNDSLVINRELDDKLLIASSLNGLGNVEYDLRNYESARILYEEALELRTISKNQHAVSKTLNNLGNLSFKTNEFEKGVKYYEESLSYARKSGDKKSISNSLHNLANLTFELGDFEKGMQFSDESLALRNELGDKLGMAESLYNLGRMFFLKEKFEIAQEYYLKSLELYRELNDVNDIALTLLRLVELENLKGNYQQSWKLLNESIRLANQINDLNVLAEALFESGCLALKEKKYGECKKKFKEYLKLSSCAESINNLPIALIYLAHIPGNRICKINSMKLLGASESALKKLNLKLQEDEKISYDRIYKMLKNFFNNEEFDKYFEEGKLISVEEAIKLINDS
jgi:predicted ATPase/class 3 adenylate cyclase